MIPLSIPRVFLAFAALGTILTATDQFLRVVFPQKSIHEFLSGVVDGLAVYCLCYFTGTILHFLERRSLTTDPQLEDRLSRAWTAVSPQTIAQPILVSMHRSPKLVAMSVNDGRCALIFVSDQFVRVFSDSALRGVLAHEMGHIQRRHTLQTGYLLAAVAWYRTLVGVSFGAIPIIILAYMWRSRRMEFEADAAAVGFVGAEDVLSALDEFADVTGERKRIIGWRLWLSGYPDLASRIDAVKKIRAADD